MISAPSCAYSFRDLIIRVADYLGVADNSGDAPAVPSEAHNLSLCKRLANDGFRRFAMCDSADPSLKGYKWSFLSQPHSLTLNADGTGPQNVNGANWRYRMPWFFSGQVRRDWTYGENTRNTVIRCVSEHEIMRARSSAPDVAGYPCQCAFRMLPQVQNTQARRWEAIFFPDPGSDDEINITIGVAPAGMSDLDDMHFAGWQHDEAVVAACLAEAEFDRDEQRGIREDRFQSMLASSIAIDRPTAPRSLGYNGDPSMGRNRQAGNRDWYTGVDSVNGTAIDAA